MTTLTLIERIHRHDYDCITPAALTMRCVRLATLRRLTANGQTISPFVRNCLMGTLPVGIVGGVRA